MKKSDRKDAFLILRIPTVLKEALKHEADKLRKSLSNHVRIILERR